MSNATIEREDTTVPEDNVTPAMRHRARLAGQKVATLTAKRNEAVEEARQVAIELYEAGMTEVELAKLMRMDRANTIRRFLGKK